MRSEIACTNDAKRIVNKNNKTKTNDAEYCYRLEHDWARLGNRARRNSSTRSAQHHGPTRKWKIQLSVKRESAQGLSQNESGASHAGISLPDGNGAQNTQVVILVIIATFQSLGTSACSR